MIQYCRYCCNALDYNGEATDFICLANAPCGANRAGKFYEAKKAKRPNQCKYFEFNPYDIFRYKADGSFETYNPRNTYRKKNKDVVLSEQLTFE